MSQRTKTILGPLLFVGGWALLILANSDPRIAVATTVAFIGVTFILPARNLWHRLRHGPPPVPSYDHIGTPGKRNRH